MDEYPIAPEPEPVPSQAHPEPPASPALPAVAPAWRRQFLRRLRVLMVAGVSTFILTAWALVRVEDPLGWLPGTAGPSHVVRRHFEALNRGEVREAYDFFSSQYQSQIPFPHYRQLVADHGGMFRTREVEFRAPAASGERTVLETRVFASNGHEYHVQFTLVRTAGKWWIDAIQWRSAPDPGNFSYT